MRTKIILVLSISLSFIFVLAGCGSDDNPVNGNCDGFVWGQEISDELNALAEAGTALSQEETVESCEVYKEAYSNYIDALEAINTSCFIIAANEQAYEQALAEARAEVNAIDCSDYE